MPASIADMPQVQFTEHDTTTGALPELLARAAQQHGPILRRATGRDFVFMVGPEANRFVLHTHRQHFSHDEGWTPIIGEDLGKGLLNMDDPLHAVHRKLWNPAFTQAYMAAYVPIMQRVIAERTATWPERDEIDVFEEAREITFDIAAGALAGFQGAKVDRLRELFYTLLHGYDPTKDTWDTFMQQRAAARTELMQRLLALITARRSAPAASNRDVLGMIVHARDEDSTRLTDAQVLAHVNILLVAGHETTTTLATWVLYLLATQPEYRRRIADELDTLTGPDGDTSPLATSRATRQLDNFIRETGRLYPPVINVPRGVVREFEFGGYTVPVGSQVRLALAATHRLPAVFADPARFDPDRFMPPREEDKQPYALVTFGGGPRVCIGINFAQVEVKALAAHVLRLYEMEPAPGQHPVHAGYWTAFLPEGLRMRVRAQSR